MLLKAFLEIGCVSGIMFRACGDVCQNIYIKEGHKGNRNICCIVRYNASRMLARLRPLGRFFGG